MNARNEEHRGEASARMVAISPSIRDESLIAPPEYRHLRAFGVTRIAGGTVEAAAGIVCLSYQTYGWATLFVVMSALNLADGYWELTIARSPAPRY